MKVRVKVLERIVTRKGLTLAMPGEEGFAKGDLRPYETRNLGKVAVLFKGRSRWYWVDPKMLEWVSGDDPDRFTAKPLESVESLPGPSHFPRWEGGLDFNFGKNLKLIRRARKLSQNQLAELMGIRQSTVSYREGRANSPGRVFMHKASEVLEVPPFSFFFPLDDVGRYMTAKMFLHGASSALCEDG